MNEVEKMYENCNIKKIRYCEVEDECPFMFGHRCEDCDLKPKPEYYIYPPFTAEKQLELIKWLGIRDEFNFYQNKVTKDWVFYDHEKDATHYNFELGLASWVDYLWQDLTEEERKQIKEILSEKL